MILPRGELVARARCGYNGYNRYVCSDSPWNNWVRWLVLGIIIVAFFGLFILCSCITSRRRRRAGLQPYRGTGWAAYNYKGQNNHTQNQPNTYYAHESNPPPQYSSNNDGGYYGGGGGANADYYGQQNGVELQQPQQAYQGNNNTYMPPPGPPPAKH
ncbi:hypothetical protein LTS18_006671 [Coniosporium uncinatum]|uniref:Uncharacterized protein n=1 Tax=Coniosporium uncinatum TaxID=93489 RepID=A0ACC3D3R9_9PEZI|nr:hypothetical protein LTS18_006671 [Coniosporium uncinatum]